MKCTAQLRWVNDTALFIDNISWLFASGGGGGGSGAEDWLQQQATGGVALIISVAHPEFTLWAIGVTGSTANRQPAQAVHWRIDRQTAWERGRETSAELMAITTTISQLHQCWTLLFSTQWDCYFLWYCWADRRWGYLFCLWAAAAAAAAPPARYNHGLIIRIESLRERVQYWQQERTPLQFGLLWVYIWQSISKWWLLLVFSGATAIELQFYASPLCDTGTVATTANLFCRWMDKKRETRKWQPNNSASEADRRKQSQKWQRSVRRCTRCNRWWGWRQITEEKTTSRTRRWYECKWVAMLWKRDDKWHQLALIDLRRLRLLLRLIKKNSTVCCSWPILTSTYNASRAKNVGPWQPIW